MRAIAFEKFGGAEVLKTYDLPVPSPRAGEVLVKILYAGVNPADWKVREGMLARYITYHFPFVPGFDLAGIVHAVGNGVTAFAPGDAVFGASMVGMGQDGAYAEFTLAQPAMLARLPTGMSFAAAAGIFTAGVTAWSSLMDVGGLRPGQKILINGGAGGVGSFAIQIAKDAGAQIAATCGPANLDYVKSLGADVAINYRAPDLAAEAAQFAPGGLDLIVDAVGNDTLLPSGLGLLRRGGTYVEIETLLSSASPRAKTLAADNAINLLSNTVAYARIQQHFEQLTAAIAAGSIAPATPQILPMQDAGLAHLRMQAGHVRGKLVLRIAESV